MFFRKKQAPAKEFDRENLRPVIRCSICTGEETAGFQNIHTGKFTEVMLLRSDGDLEAFKKEYGIDSVTTIY